MEAEVKLLFKDLHAMLAAHLVAHAVRRDKVAVQARVQAGGEQLVDCGLVDREGAVVVMPVVVACLAEALAPVSLGGEAA